MVSYNESCQTQIWNMLLFFRSHDNNTSDAGVEMVKAVISVRMGLEMGETTLWRGCTFPSYGSIQTQIIPPLDWNRELRRGQNRGRRFLISRTHNPIRTRLHCDPLCLLRLIPDSHLPCLISTTITTPPPPPTCPLPSLCCFVLSLWKIMKASTRKCVSIDVRIHNQQIQKHILGSKWERGGGWGEGRGSSSSSPSLPMKLWAAEESRVQSSFAKTVRQIVVKEWPISRH